MDFLDIIITIAILAAGGLLSGGKKKTGKRTSSQNAGTPVNRPAWSTVSGEDVHGEARETVTASNNVNNGDTRKKKNRKQSNAYFSYEDPVQSWNNSQPEESRTAASRVEDVKQEILFGGEEFDLRKAILYQTVMERVNY